MKKYLKMFNINLIRIKRNICFDKKIMKTEKRRKKKRISK